MEDTIDVLKDLIRTEANVIDELSLALLSLDDISDELLYKIQQVALLHDKLKEQGIL